MASTKHKTLRHDIVVYILLYPMPVFPNLGSVGYWRTADYR